MLRFLKNIIGKALSFCSSFNSFISCFKSWTFFRGDLFSPTSQPLPVPHLLFTPDSPLGEMYGRAGKRREGWHVERKVEEQRRTQGEWSMQKKKKIIYSQGMQMDHASDLLHKNSIHTHRSTIQAEDRNCFLHHFYTQLIHFLCFIRDVILKKGKPAAKTWGYTVYSTISTASPVFHYTWQLCNQKRRYLLLYVFGFR